MTDKAGHLAAPDLLDLLRACYGALLLAGSAVDTVHAASMAGLALAHRPLRRAAWADALLASSLAAFGIITAWQPRH